jgi:GTPase SAR1 family protein
MGDTSSGKSSVLSALSGIEFPSSDQLTTRCPTQLVLSEADVFSGTIGLKRFSKGDDIAPIRIAKIEDIAGHITLLTQKLVDEWQVISDVRDSRCYPNSS